jgi:energy-coupling factor transporter ATP-binding protein EcfA2
VTGDCKTEPVNAESIRLMKERLDETKKKFFERRKADASLDMIKQCVSEMRALGVVYICGKDGTLYIRSGGELEPADPKSTASRIAAMLRAANRNFAKDVVGLALDDLQYAARSQPSVDVCFRIAESGRAVFVNTGNDAQPVVEITAEGWQAIPGAQCPAVFFRPGFSQPLPVPVPAAPEKVMLLRNLLSITDERQWLLILGFTLGCFRVGGAHFLLALMGKPGVGKSTLARLLVNLIDPSTPPIQELRRRPDDIRLVASRRWLTAFDECDELHREQAATIAGIATGTGAQDRLYYTNHGIASYGLNRPLILSGHGNIVSEPRILDRALPIVITQRGDALGDTELDRKLAQIAPEVLGALCSLAVGGLAFQGDPFPNSETVRNHEAAVWIEKCLQSGNLIQPGAFVRAVRESQAAFTGNGSVNSAERASWSVAPALTDVAVRGFSGLASELLVALKAEKSASLSAPDWPKDAATLGKQLSARATELKTLGITVERKETKRGIHCTVSRLAEHVTVNVTS